MSGLAAVPAMTSPPSDPSSVANAANPADGGTFDAVLAHSAAPASSQTSPSGGNTIEPVASSSPSQTAPSAPVSIGEKVAAAGRDLSLTIQADARTPAIGAALNEAAPQTFNAQSDVQLGANGASSVTKTGRAGSLDRSSLSVTSSDLTSPIGIEPGASPRAQLPMQRSSDVTASSATTDIATAPPATTTPATISAVASSRTIASPPTGPTAAKPNASLSPKRASSGRSHNDRNANAPTVSVDVAAFVPNHTPATPRVTDNAAGNTPEPALNRVSRASAASKDSGPTSTTYPAPLMASDIKSHGSAPVPVTADEHVSVAMARAQVGAPPAAVGAHAATRQAASTTSSGAASHQGTKAPDASPSSMTTFAATGELTNLDMRATSIPISGHAALPGVASQLLNVIAPYRQAPNGSQSVTISLHPIELGEVHVAVTLVDGQTTVRLAAATPEGASAIRAALPNLETQLANSGQRAHVVFDNSAFSGSQAHSNGQAWTGSQPHHQPSRGQVAQNASAADAVASSPTATASIASDHAIDVRI